jgi:hypothetical protein
MKIETKEVLAGASKEYLVAAELSSQGCIALIK